MGEVAVFIQGPRAVRHFPFSSSVGSVSYKDLGNRMAMQDYSGLLSGF